MNFRSIAVLTGVFIVLAGFYYFYEVRRTEREQEKAETSKRLLDIDREKITRIDIKHPNSGLVLEKEGEDWFLAEPIKTRADTWAVERIIDTLADGSWEKEISPIPDNLADFGLDKPEIEVVLFVAGRAEPEKVLVGGENTPGDMRYTRVNQESRVLMVYAHVKNALDKTPDDLRDKRILRFHGDAVAKLEWQVDNERFSAEKKEDGWALIEPATKIIEQSRITSLIWRLEDLKFDSIFEKPEHPLAYYGLNEPHGHIRLLDEGARAIGELSFGMRKKPSVSYYAKAEGDNSVYQLSHDFVSDLPKPEEKDQGHKSESKP